LWFRERARRPPRQPDGVLASEQRPVTRQGVCEKAFAELLLVRLRAEQQELTLVSGELLGRPLDPGREGDDRAGREPETPIAGAGPLPARSR
jgi:hypothetical protein